MSTNLKWAVVGALIVATQRFALPIASDEISLTLLIVLAVLAASAARSHVVIDSTQLIAFLLFVAVGAVSLSLASSPAAVSFFQILAFWAIFVFRSRVSASSGREVLDGAVTVTVIGAFAGVVQSIGSMAFGVFWDPISSLPEVLLLDGYNSTYVVGALGTWDKSNGVFFLEPSFLSLFCALALVLVVRRTALGGLRPPMRLALCVVLLAGMVVSAAVSGLVLAPVVLLASLTRLRTFFAAAIGVVAFVGLYSVVPQLQAFIFRTTSSGSNEARLIRPYTHLLPTVVENHFWFGFGPGAADDMAEVMSGGSWTTEVTAPTLVKLAVDFGLLGVLAVGFLLSVVTLRSRLGLLDRFALLLVLLLPTNAVVNPLLTPIVGLVLALSQPPAPLDRNEYSRPGSGQTITAGRIG